MSNIMALPLPTHSLEAYVAAIHALPILDAAEEKRLAFRYCQKQDLNAARTLVESNLRFVLYIVRGYRGYGLPEGDLIQEGTIGLMKAVKHFDPAVGVRLVTFAVRWIKAEIHEFILRNWRIVKIATTKAQRKLFFNLRRYKQTLSWLSGDETRQIAQDLGVKPGEIQEMEGRLYGQDISFETREGDEDDAHRLIPAQYLEDASSNPALALEQDMGISTHREHLQKTLAKLDERSQCIVRRRFLEKPKATLQQLAAKYHISIERVRQIEAQALGRLKALSA